LADALSAAHELGIVHRDLKPDNVMIVRAKDGTERVKVVDFGIAKAMADGRTQMTRTGFVLGTPAYMSPEQISGDKLDGRSDLYSLGCMLFEMLTGQSPFSGPTGEIVLHRRLTEEAAKVRALSPDCPKNLDSIITRLLSRRVDDRIQHATELSEALDECVDEDDRRGTRPKTPIHSKATIVMNKAGATKVIHATARAATTRRKTQQKAQPNYLMFGGIAAAVVIAVGGVIAWRTLSKPVPVPTTVAQAPAPSASPAQSSLSQSLPSQSAATQGPSATPPTPDTQAAATPPQASVAPSTPSKSAPKKQPAKEKPTPTRPAPVVATTPPPAPVQPAPQPQQQVVQQVVQQPAPISPPPAAAPVVDLAAEVGHANQVVKDYVYALNDKNISRMKQLYPTMPGALETGLRALTANATDFSALMTTPPNASVLGDAGDTEFAYQLTFSTPAQGKSSPSFRYHAALAKQGGLWQIKSLTLLR
jgi:eukaryotic-like serine/threonine-protein kinase